MHDESTPFARIPLYGRGGVIRGWALVDEADAEEVAKRRWCFSARGYAGSSDGAGSVLMHRLIMGLERGNPLQVDHINRDRVDNRRANLRVISKGDNPQNVKGHSRLGLPRGVRPAGRGRYSARVQWKGKTYSLGTFDDPQEAGRAASAWRVANMPYASD